MKKPSKLTTAASLILALVALFLFAKGYIDYQDYESRGFPQSPHGSSGLSFSAYPDELFQNLGFELDIYPEERVIVLGISFSFRQDIDEREGDCFVGIFTPYNITSKRLISTETAGAIKWDYWNSQNGSLILATIRTTENISSSKIELDLTNPISLNNFGDYTLDIPLGSLPSSDVFALEDNIPVHFGSFPDYYTLLHVSIPSNAILVSESEEINDRRFGDNYQLLEFNIFHLKTFTLDYSVPEEVNIAKSKLFWSSIFLGSGLSILATESVILIVYFAYQIIASRNNLDKNRSIFSSRTSSLVLVAFGYIALDLVIIFGTWNTFNYLTDIPPELPPIITTAIGTLASTILGQIFMGKWKKPYLKIVRFDKLVANSKLTWWRVEIHNHGKNGAENCSGDVIMIGTMPNGDQLKIEGRVAWARYRNPESRIINSFDSQYLDILKVEYDDNHQITSIQFPTELGKRKFRSVFKKTKSDWEYKEKKIYPDEVKNGKWKNLIKITSSNDGVKTRKFSWVIDKDGELNLKLLG